MSSAMRRVVQSVLVACLVFGLVGVVGAAEQKVTIWQPAVVMDQVFNGKTAADVVAQADAGWWQYGFIIRTFQDLNPNVTVQGVKYPWSQEELITSLLSPTPPTVIPAGAIGGVVGGIKAGVAADITDLVNKYWKEENYSKLDPAIWAPMKYKGRIYGMPTWSLMVNEPYMYRKDWFKAAGVFNEDGIAGPPKNWSYTDLRNISAKVTDKKKDRWALALGGSSEGNASAQNFQYWLKVFGVPLVKPDASGRNTWRAAFDSPEAVQVLTWLRDTINDGNWLTGVETSFPFTHFEGGRVAMASAHWAHMAARLAYAEDNWWGVGSVDIANPPVGPHKLRTSSVSAGAYLVNAEASAAQKDAAVKFISWMSYGKGIWIHEAMRAVFAKPYLGFLPWFAALGMDLPGFTPDFVRGDYALAVLDNLLKMPHPPAMENYALNIENDPRMDEEMNYILQAVMSNPKVDLQKVLRDVANTVNNVALNYKDPEITKQIMNTYHADLAKFYQTNFPEFYNATFKTIYDRDLNLK